MRKINFSKLGVLALAVVLIFGGVFIHNARATVSGGSITGNAAADLVVGAANADYNVSFDTNVAATATTITLTFPAGYTITDRLEHQLSAIADVGHLVLLASMVLIVHWIVLLVALPEGQLH